MASAVSTIRNLVTDRRNTIVCSFDTNSPRIFAHDIHEWIHKNLRLLPTDVLTIQIDPTKRQVFFIKLGNHKRMQDVLLLTNAQMTYKHSTGEISTVRVEQAGRTTRVRIVNLPPEIPDNTLCNTLSNYGEVKEIIHETWSTNYRYPVYNGIRAAQMILTKHIPSHIIVAGYRILISYDGQPMTC
jgi:hypothetical protein